MKTIAYTSPFVPPEWLAAHGVRPLRLLPRQGASAPAIGEGLCPFAQAFVNELAADSDGRHFDAAVFATTCDQMRRAPQALAPRRDLPVFLMNVPATQTPAAADLYLAELRRLGEFLIRLGAQRPKIAD